MSTRTRGPDLLDLPPAPVEAPPDLPPAPAPTPTELPPAPLPPAPPSRPPRPLAGRWPLFAALGIIAVAVAVIATVVVTGGDEEPVAPAGGEVFPSPDGGLPTVDGDEPVAPVVPVAPAAPSVAGTTSESVTIRWTSAGASVDAYIVLRDGIDVARVPAGTRRFEDTGLVPDTTYRYSVMAETDGILSPASPDVVVHTAKGTLATAALDGSWKAKLVVRSEENFTSINAGSRYQGTWVLQETRRGVRLSGDLIGGGYVSMLLRGDGPAYRGTTREQLSQCGLTRVTDTVEIAIRVTRGATRGGAWRAVAFTGTVEDFSPSASFGLMYCPSSAYTAGITGRPA